MTSGEIEFERNLQFQEPLIEGRDVSCVERWLVHAAFCHHQELVDGRFTDRTQTAVIAFQASRGLASTGMVDRLTWDALRQWVDPEQSEWISRGAGYARQLLELDGKRVIFRDERVHKEIILAAEKKPVPHPCEPSGCYLDPDLLRILCEMSEVRAIEVGWLRGTHGKYKKTAGDTTLCQANEPISAHYIGKGADFYRLGSDAKSLISYQESPLRYYDHLDPLIAAFHGGRIQVPPWWWIMMPPELNKTYPGVVRNVEFASNDRHIDHLHVGLKM